MTTPLPTVGRIVHYNRDGEVLPAIVVIVYGDAHEDRECMVTLAVFTYSEDKPVELRDRVKYGAVTHSPNTWVWPPRI